MTDTAILAPTTSTAAAAATTTTKTAATAHWPRRFRPVRFLSATLYGGVYLCEDRQREALTPTPATASGVPTQRVVVVKQIELLMAMQLLNSPEALRQAVDDPRQEKAVANILLRTRGHPNVAQYIDAIIDDRWLYLAAEYCPDGDLYEFLHRRHGKPQLPPIEALGVLAHVVAGLRFLHAHDIAHRDLSLENVLVRDGVCKIGDFGLSARASRRCPERVGKAYYMAPEVVAATTGRLYDPRAADMWSLGIMLFILLTGSPLVPIAAVEDPAFVAFQRHGLPAVLESWGIATTLSVELVELLTGLLDVDPSRRPTSDEVLRHRVFDSWTPYVPCKPESEATGPTTTTATAAVARTGAVAASTTIAASRASTSAPAAAASAQAATGVTTAPPVLEPKTAQAA